MAIEKPLGHPHLLPRASEGVKQNMPLSWSECEYIKGIPRKILFICKCGKCVIFRNL